ncbi:MAG: SurA N-terminal domain-containing protein [Desulfobacterales bacterium]|nr:SurA N-terminal domain-containing protein [Desulfobacterales bacterium]
MNKIIIEIVKCSACRAICFILILGFTAFNMADGTEVVDRIVAVVNDDIIMLSELNQFIKPYSDKIKTLGYPIEQERKMIFKMRDDILSKLIDQKLTDQEIKRFKISVSEKEIDAAVERIKETNYYSDEELRKELAKQGLSIGEHRNNIKEQILRSKLVNLEVKSKVVITSQDVKSYYEAHRDEYCGEKKYRLLNIIMKVPSFADEARKFLIQKKMQAVLEKLKAGEPFEEVAKAYSESSGSFDIGLFTINELSPQLQEAIKGLGEGEFTSVLDTDYGYQIFYISKVIDIPAKSLEEVTAEIQEKLFREIVDKKFGSWLDDLHKKSHIKIIK